MAWRIAGTYIASCTCQLICPCPTDNTPTGPDGQCKGVAVFDISDGNLGDVDLSGTRFGLFNHWPSNLTAGDWRLGVVVDESASDPQLEALDRILRGQEGGPFEQFAALTDEWMGTERGSVSFSDGDRPSASVNDTSFTFEPLAGPEGSGAQTTVRNAAFGFAEEFRVGHATARAKGFGMEFDCVYGESADYEFASEMAEGAAHGRG